MKVNINNDICAFAENYYKLFSNPETQEHEVEMSFGEECFKLGFNMDCGVSFIKKYSEGAYCNPEELEKSISKIQDIDVLGSAVFSRWRWITHYSSSSLLSEENRKWFQTALQIMRK